MIAYLKGSSQIRVTGAYLEGFLNDLTKSKIAFWNIERQDELHYTFRIHTKNIAIAEKVALQNFCTIEILQNIGWRNHVRILFRRPILLISMVATIFLSFFMQTCVFAIDIEGNEILHDDEILRALEELDIRIGSSAGAIDQQLTKHQMLNLLPELSWIGVNRNGFKLNVLITERSFAKSQRPDYIAANIIAVRDSLLTEVTVLEGMRLCKVGDAVKKGQILVSGFEDYGLILKGVCAEGEIYGQTWYDGMVLMPSSTQEKRYTGRVWTQYSIIFGRKRINLCGSSGISGMSCDKIVEVTEVSVPNYAFPIQLEKVTYSEYELVSIEVDPSIAKERLILAWQELVTSQMIAGEILDSQIAFSESDGVYVLAASSTCHEMIARYAPMESVFEGENQ